MQPYPTQPLSEQRALILSRRFWLSLGVTLTTASAIGLSPSIVCAQSAAAKPIPNDGRAVEVEEVVVTASPVAGDPDRFATIVETVRREDVIAAGGGSVADVLRSTPGVAGTGFAAGASRPIIRGMDSERVKMVENGLSSSDVSDIGPDHGVPIDPLSAQAVEVVRGAATLRYGSQAIGGVVNTINNRIPRSAINGVKGEALTAFDSVADTGEGSLSLDAGRGRFAVHADAFARRASDYRTGGGEQDNSFAIGQGGSGGASYFFADGGRVGGAITRYRLRYGIPGETSFIAMTQTKWRLGSALKFQARRIQAVTADASYAEYSHSEIDPAAGVPQATFNNHEVDGRVEATLGQIGPISSSAVGLQVQDRRFDALGEGADYLLPTHTQSLAAFYFAEAPWGRAALQTAVRVEQTTVDGTPVSGLPTMARFTPFSASAGLTYPLSEGLRVGLTASTAGRAPAQTELFARGPHDGPGTFETGDPSLGVERADSVEATLRWHSAEHGRLEASIWSSRFPNYVYGALTGRTCEDTGSCSLGGPGDLKELNYAQRGAVFWGVELKGDYPLKSWPSGQLSLTYLGDYVRAQFTARGGDVPRIQPGRFGGGLSWTSEKLDANVTILRVGAQRRVGVADAPTDGYTSVEAQVALRPFGEGDRKPELLIVGHNLADAAIRNATALNKDRVLMPGRDLRLALRTRF